MWVVLEIGILSFPNRIMELNDDYFSGDKYGDFFLQNGDFFFRGAGPTAFFVLV